MFLAVHQPMRIAWKLHGVAVGAENKREEDVLRAFLAPKPASGTLVLPITGGSGVGKSHLICWLDAQLRLRSDNAKRHIVRIPKSASLRGVLERIVAGLSDAKYGALRRQLLSAQMPPTILEATRRLQANLLVALENLGDEARRRIADQCPKPDDKSRAAHCSVQGLIALLQDPQLAAHFTAQGGEAKGVLARIADRCLNGSRDQDQGPQNQFFQTDLQAVLQEANTARVTRAYIGVLKQPAQLVLAVGFLNEVVDRAVGDLVDFRGVSLSELFVEVRAKLLLEDRELVLLVEDFAVLAGIQGHLLDAMIREGIRGGRQELCIMRTALAVTEGRLPEGVMTRAQAEWRIEQKPFQTEADALKCFTDFVGGYLNAARWGAASLRRAFKDCPATGKGASDWVPNFYEEHEAALTEEERSQLQTFGTSDRGHYNLFPFNPGAVRQLARQFLREGDVFKYEPRLLINRLLRDTLLHQRDSFVAKAFPPVGTYRFTDNLLDVDVSRELHSRSGSMYERAALVVYYWGDNPRSISAAAALPLGVYQAFGLPTVNWSAKAERKRVEPTAPIVTAESGAPSASKGDPSGNWKNIIEAWRESGQIGQSDALKLRNFLDDAIHEWLDWDAMLARRNIVRNKRIYLPGAQQSNPPLEDALAVPATESDLKDPERSVTFYSAMRAVARYHTKKDWLYEDGEDDAALYANLIERLARQALAFYRRNGVELKPEAVKPLAQALLIDARLLNLLGASANTNEENLAAMFAAAPEPLPTTGDPGWVRLRIGAQQVRTDMQGLLLRAVGARQSGFETVYAVDAARLIEAIELLRKQDWQLPGDVNLDLFRDQSTNLKDHLRDLKRLGAIIEQRRRSLADWHTSVVEAFGEDFDVQVVVDQLREAVKLANDNGVFRPREPSHESLRLRVREMGPIKETLQLAAKVVETDATIGVKLAAAAQVDERTVDRVTGVITDFRRFLKDSGAEVGSRTPRGANSLDDCADRILLLFGKLDNHWAKIEDSSDE